MQRFKNILFYTEGSAGSSRALNRAVEMAQHNQGRLTVAGVLDELPRDLRRLFGGIHPAHLQEMAIEELNGRLARLVAPFREREPSLETMVHCGTPFLEIIRAVIRSHHDLVVMTAEGTGRLQHMLFGSTSLHLMRKCPCPVWVIKPTRHRRITRVLAAIDPDSTDPVRDAVNVKIMELATSLAQIEGAELHVLHVWRDYTKGILPRWLAGMPKLPMGEMTRQLEEARHRQVEQLLGRFNFEKVTLRVHLVQGEAGRAIPQLARRQRVDLIVMGTTARTGIAGFFVGNTAEIVLRQVNCSVLTVKPDNFVTPVRLAEPQTAPDSGAGRPSKTAPASRRARPDDLVPRRNRDANNSADHEMLARTGKPQAFQNPKGTDSHDDKQNK